MMPFTIFLAAFATLISQSLEQLTTVEPLMFDKCLLNTADGEKVVQFSLSWMAYEGNVSESNKTQVMNRCPKLAPPEQMPIVDDDTFERCKATPHNCILNNGRLFFYTGDCFREYDSNNYPWGVNRINEPLKIYSSASGKDIGIGLTLYVKELDGMLLPNSKKHNGCLLIDHYCNECMRSACPNLLLFVGNQSNSDAALWPTSVTAKNKPCAVLKYD